VTRAVAFAPATIANVAVGFDVLGHALTGAGDTVAVTRTAHGSVRIVATSGLPVALPKNAEDNTAGRALLALLPHFPPGTGFDITIDKGIALGSGMGGSAASAVAAVVAASALLEQPLSTDVLYDAARQGESAASGAAHGDNVAPALLGGLVIAPSHGAPVPVPTPEGLCIGLARPHFPLETRRAREVLREPFPLAAVTTQTEGLALVLAGCFQGDLGLVRRGLRDTLVEPRRASLIPGFAAVKQAALANGALGASIAGGGPSVFGWFASAEAAARGAAAMVAAFRSVGLDADAHHGPVHAPGARLVP
jgi:homoserine kinase